MNIKKQKLFHKYVQLKRSLITYFLENRFQPNQVIPTEAEIRDQYQVGRNTVRRALAELVKDGVIIKKHGSGSYYTGKLSKNARASYLIGVIVPKLSFYIYPEIIQGINQVVEKKGYNIVFGSSEIDLGQEMVSLQQLLDKNIDGLLIEPSGGSEDFENSDNFKKLKALDIPVIFMDWMLDDANVSFITPNDFIGGFRATQYLIDAGHQRIGFIGPFDKGAAVKRLQGYKKAIKRAGLEPEEILIKLSSTADWNKENTIPEQVHQLMALGHEIPTAIFFYNDDGAIKGCKAIRNEGYQIPGEISVMSFDDSKLATLTVPQLTSVVHPKYKLGVLGAEMLLEQLESQNNRKINQLIINPGIAIRDSVRKLNE